MAVLVESAALIVVADIVVIVGIASLGSVGEMVSQIWNIVQVCLNDIYSCSVAHSFF